MPDTYTIPPISRVSGVERAYPVWPMTEVGGVPAVRPAWMAKSLWAEMYGISNYSRYRAPRNAQVQDTPSFRSCLDKCMAEAEGMDGE